MTGVLGSDKAESAIFRASINSASLPAVGATDVPSRRTWIAHGLCKEVETEAYEVAATSTDSTDGSTTASCSFGTGGGTEGDFALLCPFLLPLDIRWVLLQYGLCFLHPTQP